MLCRTLDEIREAGAQAGAALPPLTQAQADRIAAILAPYWRLRAAREAAQQAAEADQ
jgi:hypothetical protein